MQSYKRKRRSRQDMFVLGGWLFADLLLGLAMLFAVANTVGQEPPTPSPTASPDYLATSEADLAMQQSSSQQTQEALEAQIDQGELSAQQTQEAADAYFASATETAAAESTLAAMDESQRSTAAAQSTQEALAAQGTIDALATQQAESNQSVEDLNSELATNVAQATEAAASLDAQATEQAEVAAVATENASSGANAASTAAAAQDAAATSEANAQAALATSDAASQQVTAAQATADAASQDLAAAESTAAALDEQVQLNSLDPSAQEITFRVDAQGVLAGDEDAIEDARGELERILGPYINGENCRIGFVNITSGGGGVGQGLDLSTAIAQIIEQEFAMLLPEPAEGGEAQLASNPIAFTSEQSLGNVELQLFLSAGCQPAG